MAARPKIPGLPTFRNGVHPPENKELTSGMPSRRLPFPKEIILPLAQHLGRPRRWSSRATGSSGAT